MQIKTVLLTGGAGFIGSHTAVELLTVGHTVIIVDDFSNSSTEIMGSIASITGREPICYALNVADRSKLQEVFYKHSIDVVIHCAGYKAVGESVMQPLRYYRNNIDSTLTLLEVMAEFQVKKIVFSSSATVYGVPEHVPLTEDMSTACSNPYGWTKWMIEQILRDASNADGELSAIVLRYFNPIGAHESGLLGERPQGVPNNLLPYIRGVAAGEFDKVRVFGNDYDTPDGTGVRDYIHVVDLAKGHLAAMQFADRNTGVEVFNLGTGHGVSVLEIIRAFEHANNVNVPYEVNCRRSGDVAECYADTRKAEKILGWRADKSLETMCRDEWRWQKRDLMKSKCQVSSFFNHG